jgi:cyclic pyranopterin phosphate synthase
MRAGRSDLEIAGAIAQLWRGRGDRYSETRSADTAPAGSERKVEMSYIGG